MKKGLSVLLIAAALFGFYGGAVNLNDVLACKDYWEVKGEETTADLNKLEDGLNQLKDNEEAYLDGLVAVEDGEEAMAKGEQDLAAGKAELAKGEADYAAAPAKLADARAQIAQGEDDLAAGEAKLAAGYKEYNTGKRTLATGKAALASGAKDLQSVKDLINGMKQIVNGYPEWKNGYEQLKQGRIDTLTSTETKESLALITSILTAYATAGNQKAQKAAGDMLAAQKAAANPQQDPKSFTNEQYDGFQNYLQATVTGLSSTDSFLESVTDDLVSYAPTFQDVADKATDAASKKAIAEEKYKTDQKAQREAGDHAQDPAYQEAATKAHADFEDAQKAANQANDELQKSIGNVVQLTADSAKYSNIDTACKVFLNDSTQVGPAQAVQMLGALKAGPSGTDAAAISTYATYSGTMAAILNGICSTISSTRSSKIQGTIDNANLWINGYSDITGRTTVGKQRQIVGGVAKIIGGVLGSKNDELINGMNKVASQVGFSPSQFANASTSKLAKDMASGSKLENFYQDMNKIEKGFSIVIPQLQKKADDGAAALDAGQKEVTAGETKLKAAEKQLAAGEEELAAGRAKLASGKAQYAQGLADYAAAPAKIADGRRKLAEGIQQLEDGRKELADGKDKLAEYEDGEQQVRDGLATLVATEPDGGLTSILERLDGKDKFDDPNGHLELDEGLNAVTVGREYQSDSGELITEEITKRAIGTAAGFGAAALAVLAAILSFLKKNKGAGVTAILSAVAGAVGVGVGTSAGMEFSHIAGSTVSSMPWIAAGILAAVAVAHAITHFAGSKAA